MHQRQTNTAERFLGVFKTSFGPHIVELKKKKMEPTKEDIEEVCKKVGHQEEVVRYLLTLV